MKVSIITVVYNNERSIADSIESVLSQTFTNIEYIIIDGGSTDSTLDVIKLYHSRISRVVSESDHGIYDAMNKGIKLATGDIIGILNSDDLYVDDKVINDIVDLFNHNKSCDMIYCDLVYVATDDVTRIIRRWNSRGYYKSFFEHGHVPPHPALFVKKEVYNQAGFFDLSFKLAADYEFMLRIFKKYNFKSLYFERLVVKMRLGGATNKSLANILKGNLEILRSWVVNGLKPPIMLMPRRLILRLKQYFK